MKDGGFNMKWFAPDHGDTRIVTRFLFLPLEIYSEIRWLELVKIKQSYKWYNKSWKNEKFID